MIISKQIIATGFEAFGHWIFKRRWLVLLGTLVVLAGFWSKIPDVRFDPSTEGFFHSSDPAVVTYNEFREKFGRDNITILAITSPDIFSQKFLKQLAKLHKALEKEVPFMDEVTSLVNASVVTGANNTLDVSDLLDPWPSTPQAIAKIKASALKNPIYKNLLLSEDGRVTTVTIRNIAYLPGTNGSAVTGDDKAGSVETDDSDPLDAGFDDDVEMTSPVQENRQLLSGDDEALISEAIMKVVNRFEGDDFPIAVSGSLMVNEYLKYQMQTNMARSMVIAFVVIGVLLFFLFRRFWGMALPLMIVLLGLLATIGLLGWMNVMLKMPLMILPSFLLAVGVGSTLHLLTIFFRQYAQTKDKEKSLAYALGHSGLPIFMTSLTTAAGLWSFGAADLLIIAELGIYAGFGVIICLILTLVLLPALLAILPLKPGELVSSHNQPFADRMLEMVGAFAHRRAGLTILVFSGILLIAVAGMFRLHFSHNTLEWFPKSSELRMDTELIDREMKGSLSLEILVDTGKENGVYDPQILQEMADFQAFMESKTQNGSALVGKTYSVADLIKEINQALQDGTPETYVIPKSRKLVAQEFLLFENSGSDDLSKILDGKHQEARIMAKAPWRDAASYIGFVNEFQAEAEKRFEGKATVRSTGLLNLFTAAITGMMYSTVISYGIAGVVITLLMILLLWNFGLGLLSMIPNLFPIVFILGFMGWAGIKLDMFTLLIGSIAIGMAVDDTIHFMHNFTRYYHISKDAGKAIHETLLSAGRAMLFSTLVLVCGFWVFLFATMENLFNFGLLTGVTIIVALLSDLLLAPALMTLLTRAPKEN